MLDSPIVDLRSDTVTRPTAAMREAMATAPVGDDVFGDDPTVNALQERMASELGKESALFAPSGTMANLIALLAQTRPGDSIILGDHSHPFQYEAGNIAVVGGLLPRTLEGTNGVLDPQDIAQTIIRTDDPHRAETTLVAIENTTNFGGGNIYSPETVAAIAEVAHGQGLKLHCDGARLFNAAVASGVSPRDLVAECDSVSVCFSKGLGCPVGSITAGSCALIDRAKKLRKMLGGGMRQAGVLAAAALHALDHHVDRLAEDHGRVQTFRKALDNASGIEFPMPNPTNIVFFDVADAPRFVEQLAEDGVLMLATAPTRIRAVFHLDVDDGGLERTIAACRAALT